MQKNHCDICGVETFINPRSEPQFEDKEVEIVVNEKTGEKMKVMQKMPIMTTMMRQNHRTGEMQEIAVQKVKDIDKRAYLIQLTVGSEYVHRDFCIECLNEHLRPLFAPLWDKMSNVKPQD